MFFTGLCFGVEFCAVCTFSMFSYLRLVLVTERPPIEKIAAHWTFDMFSKYKFLIVNLVFPISIFGVGISL